MTTQTEAQRLAECLDELDRQFTHRGMCGEAAAELRRLAAANKELLEVLEAIVNSAAANQAAINYPLIDDAIAAIAKHGGAA
jgi:uncharacterized protein YigA (DUF484 family)